MDCHVYSCSYMTDCEFTEDELAQFSNVTDSQENATIHVYPNREHSEMDDDRSLAILCSDIYVTEEVDDDDVYEWVADWAARLISDVVGRKVEVKLSGEASFEGGAVDDVAELNLEC